MSQPASRFASSESAAIEKAPLPGRLGHGARDRSRHRARIGSRLNRLRVPAARECEYREKSDPRPLQHVHYLPAGAVEKGISLSYWQCDDVWPQIAAIQKSPVAACLASSEPGALRWRRAALNAPNGVALHLPSEETLRDLDDVELLHGVDEIVTQFEGLDPDEAGEALGALIQEFAERHSPDAVLAQFRTLLLARDPENDPAFELAAIRKGMARRAALRGTA